jgi:hypothetical protein
MLLIYQKVRKELEDELQTQKNKYEKVLTQFQMDSQKIIEELFSEFGGSPITPPITPPENYVDPMIETNPKKRKFE